MSQYHYEPSSLTDYSFLAQETPERQVPLARIKAMSKAFECTVNDVVLTIVTAKLKKSDKARGVKTLESFLRYTPGLLSLATRNAAGPLNTLVTNIPGPQITLYQMGARMLENYPVVPMLEQMGIGIGVMSYNGSMFRGVTVDKDIVPDVGEFMVALDRTLASVERAAGRSAAKRPASAGKARVKKAPAPKRR